MAYVVCNMGHIPNENYEIESYIRCPVKVFTDKGHAEQFVIDTTIEEIQNFKPNLSHYLNGRPIEDEWFDKNLVLPIAKQILSDVGLSFSFTKNYEEQKTFLKDLVSLNHTSVEKVLALMPGLVDEFYTITEVPLQ